jgi:hypothetical protein
MKTLFIGLLLGIIIVVGDEPMKWRFSRRMSG